MTRKTKLKDTLVSAKATRFVAEGPGWWKSGLLVVIFLFVGVAAVWANVSEIAQVVNGFGKVIPSGRVQVVQHREGGSVMEILTDEGDTVERGDVLLRIDPIQATADYEKKFVEMQYHTAAIKRLDAQLNEEPLSYDEDFEKTYPQIVAEQKRIYRRQISEMKNITRSETLLDQEIDMIAPLVRSGSASRVELIRLQRQASDLDRQKDEFIRTWLQQRQELALKRDVLESDITETRDRLTRTAVRSPVKGTVKKVLVNTVGGVVTPGMDLVEIVPAEDKLLVEARIKPEDIAFLSTGQESIVRITAYDFAKYGSFDAKLVYIGSDGEVDDKGNTFYRIRVRTEKNYLGTEENPLPIKPGMVADVSIVTGQNTVASYLIKPLLRAKDKAFTEQ